MPERPKRRKNNKNKRKNKSNKPDANINNSEVNIMNVNNSGTCDDDKSPLESEITKVIDEVGNSSKENLVAGISSCSTSFSVGDLNNNSNQNINEALLESAQDVTQTSDITDSVAYIVESPDQSLNKNKLKNLKSKSLDNDDTTNIVDVTENTEQLENYNTLTLIDSQNVIVAHVDTDTEWEKVDDLNHIYLPQSQELATGTLSVTTIPLTVAQCDENKSLTPDEEKSLRSYLKTLNLVTQPENVNTIEIKTEIEHIINQEIKQRLRKKGFTDDFFLHRLGPPRILDVIDEEGSSESSMTSRRQSYLSDRKSDVEDLEDDVFEDSKKVIQRKLIPYNASVHKKKIGQLVPQECVLVGAKLKEPDVTEARGEWTMKTIEKLTGAEVVYLTDTSSSSSSLHDIGDDDGIDTDVSVRMMTPTIEVTDTENFLKKTFVSTEQSDINSEQPENTLTINNKKLDMEKNQQWQKNNFEHFMKIENASGSKEELGGLEKSAQKDTMDTSQTAVFRENHEQVIKDFTKATHNVESDSLHDLHEIEVLSTDDIKTNLYVKDIDEKKLTTETTLPSKVDSNTINTSADISVKQSGYDLETKIIKCEFNDAINNLIKEVTSDSEEAEENPKVTFTRQDSSSSVDSSQCTAKYNPNYESLNDISNLVNDENSIKPNTEKISSTSHVQDVFKCISGVTTQNKDNVESSIQQPFRLKDLCVRNIAALPYGDKILEELASVSKRLQNFTATKRASDETVKNQDQVTYNSHYQLSGESTIEKISLPAKVTLRDPVPPPIQPRHSSLKKSQDDDPWTRVATKSDPVYVCLSPSQKMLIDKTNTVITNADVNNVESKFVDKRGYNENHIRGQRVENEIKDSPVLPFKSQTGSRLLALIQDPTITRTINSLNGRINNSVDELPVKRSTLKSLTNYNEDNFSSFKTFSFKPIPPPRPRKYANSFYESDESSEFADNCMRSMKIERKMFHYSTGNLNKDIEDGVSSIQNMHRRFVDTKDELQDNKYPRRPSLPKDLCEKQMEYIRKKEKEVEAEIQRLEALKSTIFPVQMTVPRLSTESGKEITSGKIKDSNSYFNLNKKDVSKISENHDTKKAKISSLFSSSQEELLREKMYSEYVTQMAEREERKQHKVIKITKSCGTTNNNSISKSMPALDSKVNNRIEKEFISKARERWDKLGIKDPETEDERECTQNVYREPKIIEHKIKVIEGGKVKDVKKLPSHLQEFVGFTAKDKEHNAGSAGESKAGPATPHLVIMCAVIIIVIAVGKYFLRLLRYN